MNLILEPIKMGSPVISVDYNSENCQNALRMWEAYYPKIGYHFPWIGYFIRLNTDIVGSCAFTGPPVNNTVEVSYWTFKDFEGRGIAKAACRQLIGIARAENPGIQITAKTAPEKNASARILEHNGFYYSGIVQDEEIGDAWLWIYGEKTAKDL